MNKRIFKNQTNTNSGVPFYKIGTFGKKADAFISKKLFEEYRKKYPYPKKGDLLISASGSIGRVIEYTGQQAYYQDSNIVWLNHNDNLENIYLKAYYQIIHWSGIEGSTIKRLYNKNILNTKIYVPIKDEQFKVGTIIDQIEKLITLQQRKLKLLKLMKNIVSYNLVVSHKLASNDEIKWKAVYLKDIARIYQPTTITKKDLLPKGIPVFGANDYIGFYNKYNHETDQVTICARGASAGHPNYVKGPVWITGNSMVINVDETYINKKFLYTLLTFTDLKRFVTGGAQPQITRENLNSLKILLPSIKAQNNLSAIIENLSINIRKVQLSINSAKRLKQFLLQNMFI